MFSRTARAALVAFAFAVAAPAAIPAAYAQDDQALTTKQTEAVQKIVKDYLMEHPEVVGEALEALREKERVEAEQEAQKTLKDRKDEVFGDADAQVYGNPKGDVVIVEFFDYHCTYCKGMDEFLLDTVKADGKVKLLLREFPILGPDSLSAARAALAAQKQGKYLEFHRALMKNRGPLADQNLFKIAQDVGLNVEQLKKDIQAPEIDQSLRRTQALASDLDVSATPTFIIGDHVIRSAFDQSALKQMIDQARKTK